MCYVLIVNGRILVTRISIYIRYMHLVQEVFLRPLFVDVVATKAGGVDLYFGSEET